MSDDVLAPRRPRWLLILLVVLILVAAAWSGVWYFAARAAEKNIAAWMEQEAQFGRVYTCASRTFGGYPFRIEMRCSDPVVDIKTAPLVLKAKEFLALAQVLQPNVITGEIVGPFSIAEPGQAPVFTGTWQLAQASIRFTPRPDHVTVVFDGAKFDASAVNGAQGTASADRIDLNVDLETASTPDKAALTFTAALKGATVPNAGTLGTRPIDLDVKAVLRGLSDLTPKPLPVRLKEWQASGGRLEITNVRVKQGDAVAVAKGDLGLSTSGRVDGTVGLTLAGFDQVIQTVLGSQGKNTGLFAMAGLSLLGKPVDLEGKKAIAVPLRFADGTVYFGPIPLGKTLPLY